MSKSEAGRLGAISLHKKPKVACPECGREFAACAIGSHRSRKHPETYVPTAKALRFRARNAAARELRNATTAPEGAVETLGATPVSPMRKNDDDDVTG